MVPVDSSDARAHSRYRDIIFLLGAGASAEANIPTSRQMITEIERLLKGKWGQFLALYNHIKSAIHYGAGLRGLFNEGVQYNIEVLVNTLYELERNDTHVLYPFITSWNTRLLELAGSDFRNVRDFRNQILGQLKNWMCPDDIGDSDYYAGFQLLQQEVNMPLHVFSLNYDLCLDRLHTPEFRVETGFEGYGSRYPWRWERFQDESGDPPHLYLYKVHGSINWKRDLGTRELQRVEQTATIDPESMDLIFGRDFKIETGDPYLFYLYALREASLDARVLVVIGYGFGDGHINNILAQSLRADPLRRMVVVEKKEDDPRARTAQNLGVNRDQIIVECSGAKAFLETEQLHTKLVGFIPDDPRAPF